jgi:hypothetical protein
LLFCQHQETFLETISLGTRKKRPQKPTVAVKDSFLYFIYYPNKVKDHLIKTLIDAMGLNGMVE